LIYHFFHHYFKKIINYNVINTKNKFSLSGVNSKFFKQYTYFDVNDCTLRMDLSKKEEDKYSEKIKHIRTKFFTNVDYYVIKKFLEDIKQKVRKPTEIIIFTNGYLSGISSLFIRDIQEFGNAIIVGYNGNPSKKEKFDASFSPSINQYSYNNKYKFRFSLTTYESFDNINKYNEVLIPREYKINKIDEISKIYYSYDDSKYNEFISEGKRIIDLYKSKCNKDNKKLVLWDDNVCKFQNHLKGGRLCGNDGNWSKDKCQPTYCEEGFIFYTFNKTCVKDICWANGKFKDSAFRFLLIFSSIILIIIIIILFAVFFLKYYNKLNEVFYYINFHDK